MAELPLFSSSALTVVENMVENTPGDVIENWVVVKGMLMVETHGSLMEKGWVGLVGECVIGGERALDIWTLDGDCARGHWAASPKSYAKNVCPSPPLSMLEVLRASQALHALLTLP